MYQEVKAQTNNILLTGSHHQKMDSAPISAPGYGRAAGAADVAYQQATNAPNWPEVRQEIHRMTQSINANVNEQTLRVLTSQRAGFTQLNHNIARICSRMEQNVRAMDTKAEAEQNIPAVNTTVDTVTKRLMASYVILLLLLTSQIGTKLH